MPKTPIGNGKIRWIIIITSENAEEVFAKLEKEGIDPSVVWFD